MGGRRWRKDRKTSPDAEQEPVETAAHAASAPSEPSIDRSATEALLQELWQLPHAMECEEAASRSAAPSRPPKAGSAGYATATPKPMKPGDVHFPVMTPEELKPLLVPATASPELLRETFEKYGVCVVTGVLSAKECSLMEQIWLQDLLQILDDAKIPDDGVAGQVRALKANGLQEWPKEWDEFFGLRGMVPTYGLPHGSFAWAARLHPTVRRVFADLFETPAEELAVGLDLPFFASSGQPGTDSNKEWLHVDQNHCTGMTWTCAQGVLYVWPSESEDSSTTVVFPESHRAPYDQLMQDPTAHSNGRRPAGQSVKLNQLLDPSIQEDVMASAKKACRRMPCPAGSLLLWDSRVIHQGWRGGPRLAQPVCWEPRDRRSKEALRRKIWMCASGAPSSHSSAEGRTHAMLKQAPAPSPWAEGWPSLKASVVPFGVKLGKEADWQLSQTTLWGPTENPSRQADRANVAEIMPLLREEVLAAL